jgi:hypothetical protein
MTGASASITEHNSWKFRVVANPEVDAALGWRGVSDEFLENGIIGNLPSLAGIYR